MEIARMADTIEQLHGDLARESEARLAAEAHLLSLEDRALDLEQDVREECYADFEHRLALEMSRWKASLDLELDRGTEHWDRKVELMARARVVVTSPAGSEYGADENGGLGGVGVGVGVGVGGGNDDDKENVLIENLEEENERLRRELAVLRRELAGRTPTKRHPLQERGDVVSSGSAVAGGNGGGGGGGAAAKSSAAVAAADLAMAGLGNRLEGLRVSGEGGGSGSSRKKGGVAVASNGSPTKKVRKLPARKWNAAADDDDEF